MATPKSTEERLHRHMRPKKVAPRHVSLPGRIVPKKTGNNDPHRSGNPRLHNEELGATVEFLAEQCGKTGTQLQEAIENFPHKGHLQNIVGHLIAVRLGGWEQEGDHFINDSGRVATAKNWQLKEGRLAPLNRKPVDYDIDWLLEVKRNLE